MADPKCRCAGAGRRGWILKTPRSALPDPDRDLTGSSAVTLTRSIVGRSVIDAIVWPCVGDVPRRVSL